uniref:Ubiquitin-like domain-containing protein n=1 Tax=Corethron hystrix TaxID=216773 RepID=A0A7S1FWV8_9STRA|mmetsp:Transcript_34842/g.80548  ORF Transcript_34842/g.80548 Transcript_34842/m.80548 type:complete len:589 (+) Transcript_34842:78-1844(+)
MQENSCSSSIPVTIKWSTTTISNKLSIVPGVTTPSDFRNAISELSGVPPGRQTLLCKGGWKGALRDNFDIDALRTTASKNGGVDGGTLIVKMIGTADRPPPPPSNPTKFVEDLTEEELRADEKAREAAASADAEGSIVALQLPPHLRDDASLGTARRYNRLVTGMPQSRIEDLLRQRRRQPRLIGAVAMTMGMEMGRAYVNALAVLEDGTLVSGHDNGRVRLWRHGEQAADVLHGFGGMSAAGVDDGVTCVVPFGSGFTTGGRGCIRIWTDVGECVAAYPSPVEGCSPGNMTSMALANGFWCLAASYVVTRQFDPGAFRLLPQDEEGRRRRADAEALEEAIQARLLQAVEGVVVLNGPAGGPPLSSLLNPSAIGNGEGAPIGALTMQNGNLVCGDAAGGLRRWKASLHSNHYTWDHVEFLRLLPQEEAYICSVVCIAYLHNDNRLAVSTKRLQSSSDTYSGVAVNLEVPLAQAVYVVDIDVGLVLSVLDGHRDTVICICPLPDNSLLTVGGKHDAKTKMWEKSQLLGDNSGEMTDTQIPVRSTILKEAADELGEVGYVFSLAVLPDGRPGSSHFGVAAARYNVVKICL